MVLVQDWQSFTARVVAGHGVASGRSGDARFPGGTIRMQLPHFRQRGLDLSAFHPGTLNVSIAPLRYQVVKPKITFRQLRWHPTQPAEDFSFFDVRLVQTGGAIDGLIYYPHPDTKPEHFQQADVLEMLLPWVPAIDVGTSLELMVTRDQLLIEAPSRQGV